MVNNRNNNTPMEKKSYCHPTMHIIMLQQTDILCLSSDTWGFGTHDDDPQPGTAAMSGGFSHFGWGL